MFYNIKIKPISMDYSNKKASILLAIGLFAMAGTQILSRYIELSDFMNGGLIGISLGLMVLGIIFRIKKRSTQKL